MLTRTSPLRAIAAIIVAAMAIATTAAVATAPAVEAFGNLPAETHVSLSPDGHWLAWLDHKQDRPQVVMFDVQARKVQRILAVPPKTKLRSLDWSDGETLLITVSESATYRYHPGVVTESFRTIAHDASGGDGRMLLPLVGKRPVAAALVAARTAKPKTALIQTFNVCHEVIPRCLFEVDTRTGLGKAVAFGNRYTSDWVVDRDGQAVAREDWDWHQHTYRLFALHGNSVTEIYRRDDSERPVLAGLLSDGSAVVLLAANGRSRQVAWALPLDGTAPRVIAEDDSGDISGVLHDPNTGVLVGVTVSGKEESPRWLDPATQHRFEVLQRSFAGRQVRMTGWSADGQKVVALVQTPSSPPVYYLVDFATHKADIAAEEYPGLAGVKLGEVREITYKARDGTAIPAYLTLPPSAPSTAVPLVVLPHGGPTWRDEYKFDWLAQFIASRGYAVLQPQFRGSIGFGEAFRTAGYRQWGGLMQDDLSDGVHAMIAQGIADPHRVCIVGASYGGYAALAGAAFTPELYACAASIDGVSDLQALMRASVDIYGGADSTSLAFWKEHIGAPNDAALKLKSPINAARSVSAPILLVHGTYDSVVPFDQSQSMAKALQEAGKKVRFVTLPGEDHWLSRNETRVQVLKELEAFLRENLPAPSQPQP